MRQRRLAAAENDMRAAAAAAHEAGLGAFTGGKVLFQHSAPQDIYIGVPMGACLGDGNRFGVLEC